jgi:hypothetical protein
MRTSLKTVFLDAIFRPGVPVQPAGSVGDWRKLHILLCLQPRVRWPVAAIFGNP